MALSMAEFQPTLPARGATARQRTRRSTGGISTHAPRTGSDRCLTECPAGRGYFNPRSPHGERRAKHRAPKQRRLFQPTLPARGATAFSARCTARRRRFQPTLPARGATIDALTAQRIEAFQPTLPARGATHLYAIGKLRLCIISTHAPRTGSDQGLSSLRQRRLYFNPRSPHGERRPIRYCPSRRKHFNPRSPHGERHFVTQSIFNALGISTHAPRTGRDLPRVVRRRGRIISTHAPRTGSDSARAPHITLIFPCQPTLPARGATLVSAATRLTMTHFNPRSPHGERLRCTGKNRNETNVNPRSPHGERRVEMCYITGAMYNFNPRSPHGERRVRVRTFVFVADFNPRSPHGERPPQLLLPHPQKTFQPTLPARGATHLQMP